VFPVVKKVEPYKVVIRCKWLIKNNRVVGVDPASRQVEYLPAEEEGEKALDWFIGHLYEGFVEYLKGR
jgi:hypothetical protein